MACYEHHSSRRYEQRGIKSAVPGSMLMLKSRMAFSIAGSLMTRPSGALRLLCCLTDRLCKPRACVLQVSRLI
jgi:hypothetical protein